MTLHASLVFSKRFAIDDLISIGLVEVLPFFSNYWQMKVSPPARLPLGDLESIPGDRYTPVVRVGVGFD